MGEIPQKWAGTRSEPPMSEPSDSGPKPGGERGRRAARRAPGSAPKIVMIVGDPVDGVKGPPVVEPDGHIGLAEDDRAGEPWRGLTISASSDRPKMRALPKSPMWSEGASEIEAFLDCHGHAEQRAALAARKPRIGLGGLSVAGFRRS